MARSTQKKRKPDGQSKATAKVKSFGGFMAIWAFVGPVVGVVGGAFVQDYADVLRTNRAIATSYAEDATKAANVVELKIANLVAGLGDPKAVISDNAKIELRTALLNLHRDTERLRIQTGAPTVLFQNYISAMADLADSVDAASGPADARPVIEALNRFYMSKTAFEESVAQTYRPLLRMG